LRYENHQTPHSGHFDIVQPSKQRAPFFCPLPGETVGSRGTEPVSITLAFRENKN
jgi:hypothetical protein